MKKRPRTAIPDGVAAQVLFASDRTCCVCRIPGKPIQLHHIDEDTSSHHPANLSVLCLECHKETQLDGGFSRKLNTVQVRTYRDDWQSRVARRRDLADRRAILATTRAPAGQRCQVQQVLLISPPWQGT